MAASNTIIYTMAPEAATEILSQKLQMLLSHPVCIRCSLMETLTKEAKDKLATIQEFFSTQDSLSLSTVWWLGRLLRPMYDAEEFIDKFHFREACGRHKALRMAMRPPSVLISKYKLWRNLSNLVNMMQELCQDQYLTRKEAEGKTRKEPACSYSAASVPGQGEYLARLTRLWDQQSMNLRQKEKTKIMEGIGKGKTSEELDWTLIWGEQGVGKTFLARLVCREAMWLGFECCAWVRLSASMDVLEFLSEILKQTGELTRELKGMSWYDMKVMLYEGLAKRKNFLIVLDDVRPSNLPMLVRMIPHYLQGHIIITTQDDSVAEYMKGEAMLTELRKLSPQQSQEMLARKLHRVPNGRSLSNEEEAIQETCRDLPLRISLLGGLLSNAGEQERAALAKDISKMSLSDLLQLSYHRLPVHLKLCFIYMALFPLATPIPTRRLVRLWLAEGLLDSHCYNKEVIPTSLPEHVGETFILELAERNVIDVVSWRADGSPKACYMLDSLYDMIRPIVMDTGFLYVHDAWKSRDDNELDPTDQQQQLERTKVRWLAEHTNIFIDSCGGSFPDFLFGHVRSFLSFRMSRPTKDTSTFTKDTSTFLRNMISKTSYSLLRVLDLEGVRKPSLQGVLHKLVLLRYLGLRSTVLDLLPATVADLHYLETLDIKHTNITSLPSSFWKARSLRHLHLNWFYINLNTILKACSNNATALTKLQTLSGLVIGKFNDNLMRDHMDSLTTLTRLKLFLRPSGGDTSGATGKAVAHWISFRLTNLQSLTFGVTKKPKPAGEDTKEDKPATLQIVPLPKLLLTERHRNLFELYLLGQLTKPIWTQLLPGSLRALTLSDSKVEIDMMPELGGHLGNLRIFRLLANSFLGPSLRFIKDGFPSLKILKIWKLPHLERVIIEPEAMPQLKELEFRYLDSMTNVEGINECKELETICVASESGELVEKLKHRKGVGTNLYKSEDIKRPRFTDDYADNSRGKDEDEVASA